MSDLDQALSVARVHLKAGRLGEAAAIHRMLSALRPDDAEGWYRLGHALTELGDDAYAAPCFREALRLSPGHAGAAHELARALERRLDSAEASEADGRRAEAIRALGEASAIDPSDPRPRHALLRHAVAAMPEAAALPSIADQVGAYRHAMAQRELALASAALDRGDRAEAHTRFGRVIALADESDADLRRIGLAGQQMTASPRRPAPDAAEARRAIATAGDLAASGRIEDALAEARRALALASAMEESRDLLHRLKARVAAPGPRIMPGIGRVEIEILDGIWRYTPESPSRRALAVSVPYIPSLDAEDAVLGNHGPWEIRQVVRSLLAAGVAVDVVDYSGPRLPADLPAYDLVYAIHGALASIAGRFRAETLKVLWLTGSSPDYQNRREVERIEALARRGRTGYRPTRQVDVGAELASLDLADRCVILGNEHTRATFSPERRAKMTRILPTASRLALLPPIAAANGPPEFLWMGGGGAVLKGLDLVLEAFAGMPDLTLHVVGFPAEERDFDRLYEAELYHLPNVHLHGFLRPAGPEFSAILARSAVVLTPSASEGASTSLATCLAAGLFPIVSDDTGLDVDDEASIRLPELSVPALAAAARQAAAIAPERMAAMRRSIRATAAALYGRERFAREVDALVRDWLGALR